MGKKVVKNILLTVIFAAIVYYFMLPAMNLRAPEFYVYVIVVLLVFAGLMGLSSVGGRSGASGQQTHSTYFGKIKINMPFGVRGSGKLFKVLFVIIGLLAVVLIGGQIVSAEFFHASSYQKLMTVQERDFTEDISQISLNEVPVVDRDTAIRLGNRKLGELVDLVSQFEVDESIYSYTQINYNGVPTRVAPLIYGDVIKWFNNQSKGIPGYMSVDMTTQEVTLKRLDEGIRYSPGEYFFRNLDRHLRISYPTMMFGDYVFEVDDDGNPYWICPVYTYKIALFGGKDIKGVVIVDAQDGACEYYDIADVPQWIDQAYSSNIVVSQIDYWGKYKRGFINTVIGQKEVCLTTGGYNYLALEDDVWLYTGLTSVGNDQSNIGFVLVNMRTKEARYYVVSGATEESAMASAEGQVQHLAYRATFPVLLNIANQPTYFLSLKDNAGLVKKFAYVNVERYQIVGIGDSLNEAYTSYLKLTAEDEELDTSALQSVTKTIAAIHTAVKGGNTYYYIELTGMKQVFMASIELNDILAVLEPGDRITVSYIDTGDDLITVNGIEK